MPSEANGTPPNGNENRRASSNACAAGRPITIVHPDRTLWDEVAGAAPVQIRDGGYTEIPAGTRTAVAWWSEPF